MKRLVMGCEVVVAAGEGRFNFGLWDQMFYGELDGRYCLFPGWRVTHDSTKRLAQYVRVLLTHMFNYGSQR